MKKHKKVTAGNIINVSILVLLSLTIILPFLNILALSLNSGTDAAKGGIGFIPRVFSLENYTTVFKDPKFINAYGITIARTVLGTTISVLLTAMAAFAIKRKGMPGRGFFIKFFVFTMMFGAGIMPTYMTFRTLGLLNNFWVFILNGSLVAAWDIMVMRTFFEGISISLEESATLDGCNDFGILFRIFMPISLPVISVISLFKAVYHWNDWFSGAYFIKNANLLPVQTLLQKMLTIQDVLQKMQMDTSAAAAIQRTVTGESLKMATIIISILPIICVYPFIQRYFVKGLMIGSVKE